MGQIVISTTSTPSLDTALLIILSNNKNLQPKERVQSAHTVFAPRYNNIVVCNILRDSGVLSHAKNSKGVQFSTVFRSEREGAGRRHSQCVCVCVLRRKSRKVTQVGREDADGGEWLLKGSREKKRRERSISQRIQCTFLFPFAVSVCARIRLRSTKVFFCSIFL